MGEEEVACEDPKKELKICPQWADGDEKRVKAPRQRWAGAATFVIAALGSAIGLGNFWRFPYLCYKHGGGLFFVPYLLALFTCGIPMMLLELSLGQLFQRGDIGVFHGINKRLTGVGLASVFSAFGINIYYTYLIAISCVYWVESLRNPMPWSVQRTPKYQKIHCDPITKKNRMTGEDCLKPQVCAQEMYITEEYFMHDLLTTFQKDQAGTCRQINTKDFITGDPDQTVEYSWPIFAGLCVTWVCVFFCVFKGVKSSSYVVWVTVPLPVLFVFIMVLNNLALPNSDEGIRMYLRGEDKGKIKPAAEVLGNLKMWADAFGQIFFSLGVCMGIMTSYASYNRRNKPIIRDALAISFGNCLMSFFSGFAVFSIVGYLEWLNSPVSDKKSSIGLAFVAYPAAAETMSASNFWCFLLGLTLFLLGVDSAFSMVEAVATVISDTDLGHRVPRKLTALIMCVISFIFSLVFATSWGFTYFDVVDRYIAVYVMFLLGIGECFGAAWMFGRSELAGGEDSLAIWVLSLTYWINLLAMGPICVFYFAKEDENGERGSMAPGILIFWAINFVVIILSYILTKNKANWYSQVFLYGAYNLGMEVCKRTDEAMTGELKAWHHVFICWWGFSIKYFVPWALWTLMMWNCASDLTFDVKKAYGVYHAFWQVMGFMWPFVGLLCFFLPICINKESKNKKTLDQLGIESDTDMRNMEEQYRAGVLKAREMRLKASQGLELTAQEVDGQGSQVHPDPAQALDSQEKPY